MEEKDYIKEKLQSYLDIDITEDEKEKLKNLLRIEADNINEDKFLGIYKEHNPFWYWSFKSLIIIGGAICLFKIAMQLF